MTKDDEKSGLQWDGKVGPATLIGVIQLLIIVIGGIVTVAQIQNGVQNTKESVTELKNVVTTLQSAQSANSERTIKLEAAVTYIQDAVKRLESTASAAVGAASHH